MGVRNGHGQEPQTMLLALQTEPKWVKIEVQERSSRKWAPGRFWRPSGTPPDQKKTPLFGSRFGTKTRPKNEVCPERPFGQHLAPNGLRNGAKMAPKQGPKRTHVKYGKLCSRLDGSSLLASQEGSKKSHVSESLFGPLWRPLLGDALENSWLQGAPKKGPKGGPKSDPHFWTIFGQGPAGGATPPESLKPLKIRT